MSTFCRLKSYTIFCMSCFFIHVGCPCDCVPQHDTGDVLDGTAVCQQLQIQNWFYVSAKTGENVESAFECLIKQVS